MTAAALDRTLILMRHAHATSGGADHDRELSEAGHREALAAGDWLHRNAVGLDQVLCSSAERTRQTAEDLWAAGCPEADVHFDRRVYNASAEDLLLVLREADPDAGVVMLLGHTPGIPTLASLLAEGDGSTSAHEALSRGFPPAALAVLTYRGHWRDLAAGAATLRKVHCPRC